MSFKEYDGLEISAAIAKLKAKPIHDAEDIAFAEARRDMLSDLELLVITGKPIDEVGPTGDEPGNEANTSGDTGDQDKAPEGVEFVTDKLKLDELQAAAVEHGLDTSGTKKELIERINAFRTEEAAKTA